MRKLLAGLMTTGALVAVGAPAASAAPLWPEPTELAASGGECTATAVAPGGGSLAIWGVSRTLWASTRRLGGFWGAPVRIATISTNPARCDVAFDASGAATALWNDSSGVGVARSVASGTAAWSAFRVPGAIPFSGLLAVPPTGPATVLSQAAAGAGATEIRASDVTAAGVAALAVLGQTSGVASTVALEAGPGGHLLALFDAGSGGATITAATRAPGSAWQAAGTLPAGPLQSGWALAGAVAPDGTATAVVTAPRLPSRATAPVVAYDRRPGASAWTRTDVGVTGEGATLAYDTAGNATLVVRSVRVTPSPDLTSGQIVRRPAGGSWGAPETLPGSGTYAQNARGDAVLLYGRPVATGSGGSVASAAVVTRPTGGTWSAPTILAGQFGPSSPAVAIGPGGTASALFGAADQFSSTPVPVGLVVSGNDGPAAPPDTTAPVISSAVLDPYVFPASATPTLRAELSEPARLNVSLQLYSGETKTFAPAQSAARLTAFTKSPRLPFKMLGRGLPPYGPPPLGLYVGAITATDAAGNTSPPSFFFYFIPFA